MSQPDDQGLASGKLKLREDLIFTPQASGSGSYYLVECPGRSKYYRVGLSEYTFISLLDGETPFADALSQTVHALRDRDAAFTKEEAIGIGQWLLQSGLATVAGSPLPVGTPAVVHRQEPKFARWNPLWIKLRLFNPDRLLNRLFQWLGWMHALPSLMAWAVICTLALCVLVADWNRFAASAIHVFAPSNWIWLGGCWILLKILHESSHGLACKKYGGEVRETGLVLILLAPVAYIDVTSSWRFGSKWQRIHVAAAGMLIELMVATMAVLVWSRTSSPVVSHVCYNVIVMASLTTLAFNANPLMRFDGYYILADWLEIPNLYSAGSQYVNGLIRRWFLGTKPPLPRWFGIKGAFIRGYGLAACAWGTVARLGLLIAASVMFHGAGLVLSIVAAALWIGPLSMRLRQQVSGDLRAGRVGALRLWVTSAISALLCGFTLFGLPWPGLRTAPGVVEHAPLAVVRPASAGFVRKLLVHDNESVKAGQILAVLENQELSTELRDLELAIEQSHTKCNIYRQRQEDVAAQVELKNREALEKRLLEKKRQVEQLTVRAPIDGRVMARNLETLFGTHLTAGAELLAIGADDQKELQIALAQDDVDHFAAQLGDSVEMHIRGRDTVRGQLTRITPRATLEPLHLALCAPLGGPLPVRVREHEDRQRDHQTDAFELIQPRFIGYVTVPTEMATRVHAGEFGVATLPARGKTLATGLYVAVANWLDEKLDAAKAGQQ